MHMKHRVTLTMDPDISHWAKRLAKERGTSFSAMVEKLLSEQVKRSSVAETPGCAEKWRGKFSLSDRKDPRAQRLKQKYGLDQE